jgi:hypothetical protein
LLIRFRFRAVPYQLSCLLCVVGAVLWLLVGQLQVRGSQGLPITFGFGAIYLVLAGLAWTDRQVTIARGSRGEDSRVRARVLAPAAAFVILLFTAWTGIGQWQAFPLTRQLAAGDVTVVSGPIRDFFASNWTHECFAVQEHRYCIEDGPQSLGFNQTAANGGPIREGLQVRVSSIGADIVRLEVADGQ